jgi:anion-transporting  ArsA/GET3 family ATPase
MVPPMNQRGGIDPTDPPPQAPPTAVAADGPSTSTEGLLSLVREKRILITVGAGGVGKTTTAASLGLLGAACGRRTLVLTIDPARRLAVSLGLETLDNEEREVPAHKLAAAQLPPGLLHAMMLDQKRTFDEVIARHAADKATYERVRANKLYRELSTRLAGGQEYAAMEKLYDIVEGGRYDLLVLDTPPTVNAFDFLEAPQKMVEMLDSPAVKLFIKSFDTAGKLSFKVLTFGGRYVFKRLARFVGGDFLDDVAEFFADMHGMLGGFRERAAAVTELLARDDASFVIVASPDQRAINQAILFCDRLREENYNLAAFVLNRVRPERSCAIEGEELHRALEGRGVDPQLARRLAPLLRRSLDQAQSLAKADRQAIADLREACGDEPLYLQVPLLDDDVHDIEGLLALGRYLR